MARTDTITITIYTFDELNESAKDKAREWWRSGLSTDLDLSYVLEDAERVANILGITIDKPGIQWSVFGSQGDGVSFSGSYSYRPRVKKDLESYAPKDEELHRIANVLTAAQKANGNKLEASIRDEHRYFSLHVDVERTDGKPIKGTLVRGRQMYADSEDLVASAIADFANWIYKRLEEEYEHDMSDENVDENIRANGYEFYEDGRLY